MSTGRRVFLCPRLKESVHADRGLTLAEYANAKRLPLNFLRDEFRLSDVVYVGQPAVRIPYLDTTGTEIAVQFRLAMDGPERFRWRSGDKACPYGLWLLEKAGVLVRRG